MEYGKMLGWLLVIGGLLLMVYKAFNYITKNQESMGGLFLIGLFMAIIGAFLAKDR